MQAPPSGPAPAKPKRQQPKKQKPPKRQPPAPPPAPLTQAQVIAAIIAALSVAVTAAGLAAALAKVLKAWGISYLALRAVSWLVMSWPQDVLEGTGPATRWAIRVNTLRRAQFLWAACRRVQQAITAARSRNEPVKEAVQDAIAREKRYMAQHIAASHQRVVATARVDGMASQYGNLLGWQAVKDARCTPGCAAASGHNFLADRPPVVEGHPAYPGMVHGATCRCVPVPPFRGASLLPSS